MIPRRVCLHLPKVVAKENQTVIRRDIRVGREKKKRRDGKSDTKHKSRSKKKAKSKGNEYSSESWSENERSSGEGSHHRGGGKGSKSQDFDIVREQMGLEWMLRPKDNKDNISSKSSHIEPEGVSAEEVKKDNPRELNPYLKDNGIRYPKESDGTKAGDRQLLSSAVVGDGGASWRLKALKRAREQAAREGRKLQEVVEERWDSMGNLAASGESLKRDVKKVILSK